MLGQNRWPICFEFGTLLFCHNVIICAIFAQISLSAFGITGVHSYGLGQFPAAETPLLQNLMDLNKSFLNYNSILAK